MSSSLNKLAIFAIDRSQNQNDVAKYNDLNLYSVDYGIDKKGGAGYRVITSKNNKNQVGGEGARVNLNSTGVKLFLKRSRFPFS
jgi:hypothetical protein